MHVLDLNRQGHVREAEAEFVGAIHGYETADIELAIHLGLTVAKHCQQNPVENPIEASSFLAEASLLAFLQGEEKASASIGAVALDKVQLMRDGEVIRAGLLPADRALSVAKNLLIGRFIAGEENTEETAYIYEAILKAIKKCRGQEGVERVLGRGAELKALQILNCFNIGSVFFGGSAVLDRPVVVARLDGSKCNLGTDVLGVSSDGKPKFVQVKNSATDERYASHILKFEWSEFVTDPIFTTPAGWMGQPDVLRNNGSLRRAKNKATTHFGKAVTKGIFIKANQRKSTLLKEVL